MTLSPAKLFFQCLSRWTLESSGIVLQAVPMERWTHSVNDLNWTCPNKPDKILWVFRDLNLERLLLPEVGHVQQCPRWPLFKPFARRSGVVQETIGSSCAVFVERQGFIVWKSVSFGCLEFSGLRWTCIEPGNCSPNNRCFPKRRREERVNKIPGSCFVDLNFAAGRLWSSVFE